MPLALSFRNRSMWEEEALPLFLASQVLEVLKGCTDLPSKLPNLFLFKLALHRENKLTGRQKNHLLRSQNMTFQPYHCHFLFLNATIYYTFQIGMLWGELCFLPHPIVLNHQYFLSISTHSIFLVSYVPSKPLEGFCEFKPNSHFLSNMFRERLV